MKLLLLVLALGAAPDLQPIESAVHNLHLRMSAPPLHEVVPGVMPGISTHHMPSNAITPPLPVIKVRVGDVDFFPM